MVQLRVGLLVFYHQLPALGGLTILRNTRDAGFSLLWHQIWLHSDGGFIRVFGHHI